MARTRKITDEQILKAAQAVFLEKGFGASTLEIAEQAGVSEGSIFKRFSTKEKLFFTAMGLSDISSWLSFLETVVGQGDLKENLKTIGLRAMEFSQEHLPKMMMLMSKGVPAPTMLRSASAPPIRNLKALTRFFEKEIALGRMQTNSPQVIAQMFAGSVMNYVFLSQMAPVLLPEPQEYIDSVVEILWKSIQPNPHSD
ncbi:MAG: TetR/AcrR family transcriptional regulator [Cyanobacteria bacterium P01_A01_bin.114]